MRAGLRWAEPRRRGLAALVLGVLAAHALLLGGLDELAPGAGAPNAAPALQVRAVPAAAPAAVAQAEAVGRPPVSPPARPRPAPRPRAAAAPIPPPTDAAPAQVPDPGPDPVPEPIAEAVAAVEAPTSAPEAAVPTVQAEALPAAPDAAPELPTYPTRLPPAATLQYELQRGRLAGQGELRWQPDGERYALQLVGSLAGIALLTQRSQGELDANGLAPQRFTDQRIRRAAQAANFDRAAGRITFSGPSFALPLRAGVQDRLAWMIQLAAIVAADAQRAVPDATTVLQVVGARGDAGLWVFRCAGMATLETPAGSIEALRFQREPRGPHDTGVEVWLDPARHHLPVRATMRNGGDGEALELRLREASLGG